jgi:hypothetical protein
LRRLLGYDGQRVRYWYNDLDSGEFCEQAN